MARFRIHDDDLTVRPRSTVSGSEHVDTMETIIRNASSKAVALAALYISQSMLLELEASGKMTDKDVQGLLKDALRTLSQSSGFSRISDTEVASRIVEAIRGNHERLKF